MTNRQAATLASRIFCVWFIYNAVSSLILLPNLFALIQQTGSAYSAFGDRGFAGAARAQRTMLVNTWVDLARLCIDIAAAIFFYRCGPGLIRFLTGAPGEEIETTT
jgi:hypothetical protein